MSEKKTPLEQMRERFQLNVAERIDVGLKITEAETKAEDADPELYERYDVLTDNIDCLLARIVKIGLVESEPVEEKDYELDDSMHWKQEAA
jgi:hypothetical protein